MEDARDCDALEAHRGTVRGAAHLMS